MGIFGSVNLSLYGSMLLYIAETTWHFQVFWWTMVIIVLVFIDGIFAIKQEGVKE